VGVALFLTHLAEQENESSALHYFLSRYYMSKKINELTPQIDVDAILVP
jgi:phosphomannomutase